VISHRNNFANDAAAFVSISEYHHSTLPARQVEDEAVYATHSRPLLTKNGGPRELASFDVGNGITGYVVLFESLRCLLNDLGSKSGRL
jgi:hypothetical protein